MRIYTPLDSLPEPPSIDIVVNGQLVERFVPRDSEMEKRWVVPSRQGEANELRIITSATVVPVQRGGSDGRELGLRINGLSWTPVH